MRPSPCSADTLTWLAERPSVRVVHLQDPVIEALGFDARSGYAEAYWLGILGPSALWALRRLSDGLARHPDGFVVELGHFARELGLGEGIGRHAPVVRAVARLVNFRMVEVRGEALAVRRSVPPLAGRHLARLPRHLVERHRAEMEAPSPCSTAGAPTSR
jgi:hypothetical protein